MTQNGCNTEHVVDSTDWQCIPLASDLRLVNTKPDEKKPRRDVHHELGVPGADI